jgi:CBS domain-containing protein
LSEETVTAIRTQPCTIISPDTPVHRALQTMVDRNISCLLVAEDERLVGVFTRRDVLDKAALRYDEVKAWPVSELMTRNPSYVYETDPVAAALCVMASGGHRHVPVLDDNHKIAGIVGPVRVTRFLAHYVEGE